MAPSILKCHFSAKGVYTVFQAKIEIWSEKMPDLSHLGSIWPTFGPNLTYPAVPQIPLISSLVWVFFLPSFLEIKCKLDPPCYGVHWLDNLWLYYPDISTVDSIQGFAFSDTFLIYYTFFILTVFLTRSSFNAI